MCIRDSCYSARLSGSSYCQTYLRLAILVGLYLGRRYTASKCFTAPQHSPRLLSIGLNWYHWYFFDAADERLFCKILHHPNHLLAPLLHKESHTSYHLRPRRHNRQLTPKINKLYDSNFVQCMLYKDLYWLTIFCMYVLYSTFLYCVSRVELRFVNWK